MQTLENHIELISNSSTSDEAFQNYCNIIRKYGYERVVYSLMTDHPSIDLPRQHGLASSYPQSWVDYYNEAGYMDHDPVADELLKTLKPFYWDDLLSSKEISSTSKRVMNEAVESGLCNGVAFSMPGKYGEVSAFGLARTDADNSTQKDYAELAQLHLLSVYFHETFRQMHREGQPAELTDREREVLQWASEGKTDDVIAELMNISSRTVRYHWNKIFCKLNAHGRIFAVTKAIRLELITPVFIKAPCQK